MTVSRVAIVGEGPLDLAVLRRLLEDARLGAGPEHGRRGKGHIDQKLQAYNAAARHMPWLVLRDLDADRECAGELVKHLLPVPSKHMIFRIAVRAIESWLLADVDAFSKAFSVPVQAIPVAPEAIIRPKQKMLEVLARSTSRECRTAMLLQPSSDALKSGPEYNALLVQFAQSAWQPKAAARRASSLAKARHRIQELVDRLQS